MFNVDGFAFRLLYLITFVLSSSLHGIPIAMDVHKLSNTVLNLQIVRLSSTFQYIVLFVPDWLLFFIVA